MSSNNEPECCPRFEPKPWDETEFTWENKRFVQDRVTSFLHIPLNFGAVMKRVTKQINDADAFSQPVVILSDENSLWGADVYIGVKKEVENATMAGISGTFLSRIFEGPYKNMRTWIKEMEVYVRDKGKNPQKFYFFYTTCPKCAKKYGKNYVVILARVS